MKKEINNWNEQTYKQINCKILYILQMTNKTFLYHWGGLLFLLHLVGQSVGQSVGRPEIILPDVWQYRGWTIFPSNPWRAIRASTDILPKRLFLADRRCSGNKFEDSTQMHLLSINQSVNQLFNQSVNQSINQSVNWSISQLINQSINQSVN